MRALLGLSLLSGIVQMLLNDGWTRSGVTAILGLVSVRLVLELIFDVMEFIR